ncbi:hypothetical protein HaLaN_15022, partial [Haematococcus lacustris]
MELVVLAAGPAREASPEVAPVVSAVPSPGKADGSGLAAAGTLQGQGEVPGRTAAESSGMNQSGMEGRSGPGPATACQTGGVTEPGIKPEPGLQPAACGTAETGQAPGTREEPIELSDDTSDEADADAGQDMDVMAPMSGDGAPSPAALPESPGTAAHGQAPVAPDGAGPSSAPGPSAAPGCLAAAALVAAAGPGFDPLPHVPEWSSYCVDARADLSQRCFETLPSLVVKHLGFEHEARPSLPILVALALESPHALGADHGHGSLHLLYVVRPGTRGRWTGKKLQLNAWVTNSHFQLTGRFKAQRAGPEQAGPHLLVLEVRPLPQATAQAACATPAHSRAAAIPGQPGCNAQATAGVKQPKCTGTEQDGSNGRVRRHCGLVPRVLCVGGGEAGPASDQGQEAAAQEVAGAEELPPAALTGLPTTRAACPWPWIDCIVCKREEEEHPQPASLADEPAKLLPAAQPAMASTPSLAQATDAGSRTEPDGGQGNQAPPPAAFEPACPSVEAASAQPETVCDCLMMAEALQQQLLAGECAWLEAAAPVPVADSLHILTAMATAASKVDLHSGWDSSMVPVVCVPWDVALEAGIWGLGALLAGMEAVVGQQALAVAIMPGSQDGSHHTRHLMATAAPRLEWHSARDASLDAALCVRHGGQSTSPQLPPPFLARIHGSSWELLWKAPDFPWSSMLQLWEAIKWVGKAPGGSLVLGLRAASSPGSTALDPTSLHTPQVPAALPCPPPHHPNQQGQGAQLAATARQTPVTACGAATPPVATPAPLCGPGPLHGRQDCSGIGGAPDEGDPEVSQPAAAPAHGGPSQPAAAPAPASGETVEGPTTSQVLTMARMPCLQVCQLGLWAPQGLEAGSLWLMPWHHPSSTLGAAGPAAHPAPLLSNMGSQGQQQPCVQPVAAYGHVAAGATMTTTPSDGASYPLCDPQPGPEHGDISGEEGSLGPGFRTGMKRKAADADADADQSPEAGQAAAAASVKRHLGCGPHEPDLVGGVPQPGGAAGAAGLGTTEEEGSGLSQPAAGMECAPDEGDPEVSQPAAAPAHAARQPVTCARPLPDNGQSVIDLTQEEPDTPQGFGAMLPAPKIEAPSLPPHPEVPGASTHDLAAMHEELVGQSPLPGTQSMSSQWHTPTVVATAGPEADPQPHVDSWTQLKGFTDRSLEYLPKPLALQFGLHECGADKVELLVVLVHPSGSTGADQGPGCLQLPYEATRRPDGRWSLKARSPQSVKISTWVKSCRLALTGRCKAQRAEPGQAKERLLVLEVRPLSEAAASAGQATPGTAQGPGALPRAPGAEAQPPDLQAELPGVSNAYMRMEEWLSSPHGAAQLEALRKVYAATLLKCAGMSSTMIAWTLWKSIQRLLEQTPAQTPALNAVGSGAVPSPAVAAAPSQADLSLRPATDGRPSKRTRSGQAAAGSQAKIHCGVRRQVLSLAAGEAETRMLLNQLPGRRCLMKGPSCGMQAVQAVCSHPSPMPRLLHEMMHILEHRVMTGSFMQDRVALLSLPVHADQNQDMAAVEPLPGAEAPPPLALQVAPGVRVSSEATLSPAARQSMSTGLELAAVEGRMKGSSGSGHCETSDTSDEADT